MPLTDNACRNLPVGKKSDGGGLYLRACCWLSDSGFR